MKAIIFSTTFFLSISLYSQVGIGTNSPHASAQLEMTGTSRGLLIPRLTAAQKGAISSPATGLLVFQNDATPGFYYFTGSDWILLTNNLVTKVGGSGFTNSMVIGHDNIGTTNAADRNLGIGSGTFTSLYEGADNIAIGHNALASDENFSDNLAIGNYALYNHNLNGFTGNTYNLGIGNNALYNTTYGEKNIAIGYNALYSNTQGNQNIAIGFEALKTKTTSDGNIAIGSSALKVCNTGDNVAIGRDALVVNSTGNNNTVLGAWAADNSVSGSNNIVIGYGAKPSTASISNQVTIGNSSNNSYRIYAASWTNASDAKYKHAIADIPAGLDFVKKLRPVEFVYNNAANEEKSYGFIAQEVKQVVEDLGLTRADIVEQMDPDHLGIKTTELIPILTRAIQQQQAKIEALEARLTEQEKNCKSKKAKRHRQKK